MQYQMCHNATLSFIHDDMKKTVAVLESLYRPCRDGIKGIHITYQRECPADLKAFKRLCQILKDMNSLKALRLELPFNATPRQSYTVAPEPGLINMIVRHKDNILRQLGLAKKVLQGYAWKNSRRASWVQDLLTVNGKVEGSLSEFELTTGRVPQLLRLKDYLENYMCEEKEIRDAQIRRLQAETSWLSMLTFEGLLTTVRELRM